MGFLNDIAIFATSPTVRYLAAWVDLCVFALTLPGNFSIFGFVIFGLSFCLLGVNLTIGFLRRKQRHAAEAHKQVYVYQPKIWVFTLDFIFAILFTAVWILRMTFPVQYFFGRSHSPYFYYNIFTAYTTVGYLTMAHIHWFLGAIEAHLHRQVKKGKRVDALIPKKIVDTDDVYIEDVPAIPTTAAVSKN